MTKYLDARSILTGLLSAALLGGLGAGWKLYVEWQDVKRELRTIEKHEQKLDWLLYQTTLLRQEHGLPFVPFGKIE